MEQKIRRDRNMGTNLRRLRLEHDISQEKLCAELQRLGCDIGRTTYAKEVRILKPLKKKVSITLDEDLIEWLRVCAEENDRSLSQLINLILKSYMKKNQNDDIDNDN